MEKQIKIALAGNPNCGKTTLFNALTGSNQFVGNWPGVTVEKKEGKLKKHDDVVIMDLPGIYSLSPYTLEEVVARNYLITERPDAILNIIDGTNLERNLYLTTQLTELGIPVVIAINMMDVVRKNGDEINVKELSRELGCEIIEISALKGDGVMDAAEAAVRAASGAKTVPMHTFSGPVEHAIAHIEEAAVHGLPEEQQRWYAIKIFERDDKVLAQLKIPTDTMEHIEQDMRDAGISKICGSVIMRDNKNPDSLENIRRSNYAMYKIWDMLGDFYVPGMMVHPKYVEESKEMIDEFYARGGRLIGELVPYTHGWSDYSCEGFSELLDYATEKNMIVSIHSMGEDEMDRMSERHPDTKIVFAHPGEYNEAMRHIKRMKNRPNHYLDLSGYGIFRMGLTRRLVDEIGVDRIIFGSDYPTCNPYMYVGGVLLDPSLTDKEKEMIFAGNVRRLFASVGKEI